MALFLNLLISAAEMYLELKLLIHLVTGGQDLFRSSFRILKIFVKALLDDDALVTS